MALTPLTFTPATGYNDAVTFPDPATETIYRAQIQNLHDQTKAYVAALIAEMLSTANGKGASQVGVEDAGSKFTGTNVEAVLTELEGLVSTHTGEVVSQHLTATRDISVAGVQTITGLAKMPKRIEIRSGVNTGAALMMSTGSWEANGPAQSNVNLYTQSGAVSGFSTTAAVGAAVNAANYTTGAVQSVTSSQFEINWAKTGSPTGIITMEIIAHYH